MDSATGVEFDCFGTEEEKHDQDGTVLKFGALLPVLLKLGLTWNHWRLINGSCRRLWREDVTSGEGGGRGGGVGSGGGGRGCFVVCDCVIYSHPCQKLAGIGSSPFDPQMSRVRFIPWRMLTWEQCRQQLDVAASGGNIRRQLDISAVKSLAML
ncbi:unnamed protein product [Pleuronectes platessa]|uniref:Uncharacterized protein n=1 Tax=Pleuronectes platessa TaxID=8262 RepID=A0A9N7TW34_PLEPL|nr:unnamed protein product [Pleuronectes platessa]